MLLNDRFYGICDLWYIYHMFMYHIYHKLYTTNYIPQTIYHIIINHIFIPHTHTHILILIRHTYI